MTICKECRKVSLALDSRRQAVPAAHFVGVSKDKENNFQNDKNTLAEKLPALSTTIECTSCNRTISKTNWSKHKKTIKHSENVKTPSVIYI